MSTPERILASLLNPTTDLPADEVARLPKLLAGAPRQCFALNEGMVVLHSGASCLLGSGKSLCVLEYHPVRRQAESFTAFFIFGKNGKLESRSATKRPAGESAHTVSATDPMPREGLRLFRKLSDENRVE